MSYETHTNRELEFMLQKGKPFAHFSDYYPSPPDEDIIPELAFLPYVESGRFVKREYVEPLRVAPNSTSKHITGIRYVLYAQANEAWRMEAFIAMKMVAAKVGWSVGFERLEGYLLGYEEWQTDQHLATLKARKETAELYWLKDAK